jgi:hypothetical protein
MYHQVKYDTSFENDIRSPKETLYGLAIEENSWRKFKSLVRSSRPYLLGAANGKDFPGSSCLFCSFNDVMAGGQLMELQTHKFLLYLFFFFWLFALSYAVFSLSFSCASRHSLEIRIAL